MPNEAYLFRLEASPPAYLWSGVGDLDVPGDNLVGPGITRYKGIGTLTGLPVLENLINAVADRADFVVSGVDAIALGYANEDKNTIPGSLIRIGSVPLGDGGQPIGPVDWECRLVADTISVDSQGGQNGSRTRSITVSAATATATRSTSGANFFTDADQREISPDDAFFSYIAGIQNTSRRFGTR